MLGHNLFPYQLLSEKLDNVFTASQIDTTGKENLELAYAYFSKNAKQTQITEDEFISYSQAILDHLDQLDDGTKIRIRLQRSQGKRQQFMLRCYTLRLYCEKFSDPLVDMYIPVFQQQKKTYSVMQDRYLIYLTNCFGYGRWSEILTFIRCSPVFVFDWWFKSRDEEEICSRVDRLIRAIA